MELLLYIIKVNMAILLLYSVYRLLFQRDTFFRWKRFTLLAIPIIALLYPLSATLGSTAAQETAAGESVFPVYYLNEIIVTAGSPSLPAPLVSEEKILWAATLAYLAVALLLLLRITLQAAAILLLVRKASPSELYGRKIYVRKGLPSPFSFFSLIALDPEKYSADELKEILLHETTHVRQGHSFDLIFSEVVCSLCWLNPFSWLLKREIRVNLECLADHAVLQSGCEAKRYQLHLLRLSYAKATAILTNNFNVSLLKKRIIMMNRKKTSPVSICKYALLAPAFAFLAFFNQSLRAEIHLPSAATGDPAPAGKNAQDTTRYYVFTSGVTAPEVVISAYDTITLVKKTVSAQKDDTKVVVARAGKPTNSTIVVTYAGKPAEKPKQKKVEPVATGNEADDDKKVRMAELKADVFSKVDEMPAFPGGDNALRKYLAENCKYPASAVRDSVQGRVVACFVVSDSGKISDVKILRSVRSDCDAEAVRIIEAMPTWIPGKEKGKAVNVLFTVPIVFRLK